MGSLAILTSSHNTSDMNLAATALAELNDADYNLYVLQHTDGLSEQDLDEKLRARAETLGISIRPHTPIERTVVVSSPDSHSTVLSSHARIPSTASAETARTTPPSTPAQPSPSSPLYQCTTTSPSAANPLTTTPPRTRARTLTFSQYDKYLAQVEPNLNQPKFLKQPSPVSNTMPSLFNSNTRMSVLSIKNGIKTRIRWRKRASCTVTVSCICCRDDFNKQNDLLHTLPCGHTYCGDCLRIMINQATTDESKMPPRCCTQPIPSSIIKPLLAREEQQVFLKSVQQFSTPWEARVFCPNPNCNEFVPPRVKVDPKHPFDVVCRECRTRVCTMCKMRAHPLGQDCPSDMELDKVLRMGEKSGWRRCYKCRTLVELTQGCTHMTCRCKAQFCYICGAIWDPAIGCPNFCNGEEELERRRREEAEREAEELAKKAAQEAEAAAAELERQEAEKRTQASAEFRALKQQQEAELERFLDFERNTKWKMWTRHHERKRLLNEKYSDQTEKMRERHAKTEQHLEERQIAAEIELRASLEQAEKSVRIRVKHMEAYCKALGRTSTSSGSGSDENMPPRVVTERHLRELGQQHNALEGMARLHQAKINVLRDRQAKRMEELLERQEKELEKLDEKREEDIEDLAAEFAHEEDTLTRVFEERRTRLVKRWELGAEVLRVEMETGKKEKYATMSTPEWPPEESMVFGSRDGALSMVNNRNGSMMDTDDNDGRQQTTDDIIS